MKITDIHNILKDIYILAKEKNYALYYIHDIMW